MDHSSTHTMSIGEITIPARHRQDVGDLTSLKASLSTIGLLHPVVVSTSGTLIAGARRLEAARQLGWTEIKVTVAANLDTAITALRAERDENAERKDFTPSEAVAIARALEPLEREAAKKRQGARTDLHGAESAPSHAGKARDKIAAAVGVGRDTLAKATTVVEAAERDPETYTPLVADMDRTGNVHGAYRRYKQHKAPSPAGDPIESTDDKLTQIRQRIDRAVAEYLALLTTPGLTLSETNAISQRFAKWRKLFDDKAHATTRRVDHPLARIQTVTINPPGASGFPVKARGPSTTVS